MGDMTVCKICDKVYYDTVGNDICEVCVLLPERRIQSHDKKNKRKITTKFCDFCGKETLSTKSFCSDSCRTKAKAYDKLICIECTRIFYGKKDSDKFCSTSCEDQYFKKNAKSYKCHGCGNTFKALKIKKYCSVECREGTIYVNTCKICGKLFTGTEKKDYCSDNCLRVNEDKSLLLIITELVETLINRANLEGDSFNGKTIDYWSVSGFNTIRCKIVERDGYRCQICGQDNNLDVHHIIPRSQGGNHSETNLITLCKSCHRNIETRDSQKAIKKCYKNAKKYYYLDNKEKSKRKEYSVDEVFFMLEEVYTSLVKNSDKNEIIERLSEWLDEYEDSNRK